MDRTSVAFPFTIDERGRVAGAAGDANIRAKILEIVLTAPGERVGVPTFGCGLRDLVFDPNNDILAATTEFAITKALQQWMSDDIVVQGVTVGPRRRHAAGARDVCAPRPAGNGASEDRLLRTRWPPSTWSAAVR